MRKDIVCGLNYQIISHSRNAEDFGTDLDNQETYKKNARSTKSSQYLENKRRKV